MVIRVTDENSLPKKPWWMRKKRYDKIITDEMERLKRAKANPMSNAQISSSLHEFAEYSKKCSIFEREHASDPDKLMLKLKLWHGISFACYMGGFITMSISTDNIWARVIGGMLFIAFFISHLQFYNKILRLCREWKALLKEKFVRAL